MSATLKRVLRIVSTPLFTIGSLLIVMNLIGFYLYTTIEETNVNILDKHPREISEQQFWDAAFKQDNETIESYVERLTSLVSRRMLFIDPKYAKPTIFENWILWAYSQYLGKYEWTDTKKAGRLGGGFCSQHAIVLNNILRSQGIESRILSLNGHVLNEVLINEKWRVYDPMFNIVFNASLKQLESNPERVYQVYTKGGLSENEAKQYQHIFSTDEDNHYFETSRHYSWRKSLIEEASFYLR